MNKKVLVFAAILMMINVMVFADAASKSTQMDAGIATACTAVQEVALNLL